MTFIVVDPFMVTLPEPCYSEQFDYFLKGLLDWSEALSREDVPIFVSGSCLNALYQDGWFPLESRLKRLINEFDIDYATEEDISQVIRTVFNREPRLEACLDWMSFVYDEKTLILDPELICNRLGNNTSKAFKESLINISVSEIIFRNNHPEFYLATSKSQTLQTNERIYLAADIYTEEKVDSNSVVIASNRVETNMEISFSYIGILSQTDIIEIWDEASSHGKVVDAVNKMIALHCENGLPSGRKEPLNFRLGCRFLESIHDKGFHSRPDWARLLIDSCARIILGIPKNDVDEFREDERPQSAQRTRKSDQALAWRTHLTKSNEGFRLMFWTTSDGVIEFANVGPKKELIIYE